MINLTISPKQHEMLLALEDDEHTEVFLGGAAGGCGVGNTRTSTIHGERFLKDLKKGDIVLTFNHKKKITIQRESWIFSQSEIKRFEGLNLTNIF